MTGPYDVVLLDFGGVCLLNPVELHPQAEALLGLESGSLRWLGPLDPATDPLWRQMIAGDGLTERDYWRQRATELGAAAGIELTVQDYMRLLYDPPDDRLVRPGAVAVAARARQAGIGVSVLTNDMRDFHGQQWERGISFLRGVDHIVDCSDTGILKPDPRAFERAIDIVAAQPERILFVDDQPRNVDGAAACGIDAIWFDIADADRAWSAVGDRLGSADPVDQGRAAEA